MAFVPLSLPKHLTHHINLKVNFQLQEAKGIHSDVALGHSQLLCIGYLWFQHT